MRFAHLGDSHLGRKLAGEDESKQDYYDIFRETINRIIEEDVDFIVHSGDIFDVPNPDTEAMLIFQEGLLKLQEANIPIYAISGNHDLKQRRGFISPLEFYRIFGLHIIDDETTFYEEKDNTLVCGVQYIPAFKKNTLIEKMNELSELVDDYDNSIILIHQGIEEYLPFGSELSLNELPINFNYYAMGHLHYFVKEKYGNGVLVYPNSLGIGHASQDFEEPDKGFCIVTMENGNVDVERIIMGYPRQWTKCELNYDNLDKELDNLFKKVKKLDRKPLLDITIKGGSESSSDVYSIVLEKLDEYALSIRQKYETSDEEIHVDVEEGVQLDARTALYTAVNDKYDNEDVAKFSVQLLDSLSSGDMKEAKSLADEFYDKHYKDSGWE